MPITVIANVPAACRGRAASSDGALGLIFGGLVVLLPMILGYTTFSYWLFRGKVSADAHTH